MSSKVFISYAHKDEEFIHKLALDLEDRKVPVWVDHGDLHGGMDWESEIKNNIRGCQVFILMISPRSMASQYVMKEIDWALEYGKPIVPLFYQNTKLTKAQEQKLSGFQYHFFNRGGYANNLTDLLQALRHHNVQADTDSAAVAQRRRQRLGQAVKPNWGQVFAKTPGWAFAWSLGWAIFWVVLLLIAFVLDSDNGELSSFVMAPLGGAFGGFLGGLGAGLFTMFALRHHTTNIGWKHMRVSIWIWGFIGPVGAFAVGAISVILFTTFNAFVPSACDGGLAECIGQGFGEALGYALVVILVALLWALIAVFGVGLIAGWFAVRRIRRLEPGILGRQAIWVMIGWGLGAIGALLGTGLVLDLFLS